MTVYGLVDIQSQLRKLLYDIFVFTRILGKLMSNGRRCNLELVFMFTIRNFWGISFKLNYFLLQRNYWSHMGCVEFTLLLFNLLERRLKDFLLFNKFPLRVLTVDLILLIDILFNLNFILFQSLLSWFKLN